MEYGTGVDRELHAGGIVHGLQAPSDRMAMISKISESKGQGATTAALERMDATGVFSRPPPF